MVKLVCAVWLLALVPLLNLAAPPWYGEAPVRTFQGDRWYDPYAGSEPTPLQMNLHVHSSCWGGLTNGSGTALEVAEHYRDLGYDCEIVSNYQTITPHQGAIDLYLPAYEHGVNAGQQHHTVVGSPDVLWCDYILWQGARQKQHLLDLLDAAPFVVINHPSKGAGFSLAEMGQLCGFDAVEIVSKYGGEQTAWWDAALTGGRVVWGVCSDDGHHVLTRKSHSGIGWIHVFAAERSSEAILAALQRGQFYAVRDRKKVGPNRLVSAGMTGDAFALELAEPADSIRFVGPEGVVLKEVQQTATASYSPRPGTAYVRAEATTRGTKLYLNPILAGDGELPERLQASVQPGATLAVQLGAAVAWLIPFIALVRRLRRPAPPAG